MEEEAKGTMQCYYTALLKIVVQEGNTEDRQSKGKAEAGADGWTIFQD